MGVEPREVIHALHYVDLLRLLALPIGAGHLAMRKIHQIPTFHYTRQCVAHLPAQL